MPRDILSSSNEQSFAFRTMSIVRRRKKASSQGIVA